ncbi:MAG: hypothetical protein H2043_17900 [Rhizobiales bacterium]|jgi:hypothetical protein|nr:hypothetical protein [Hyphomicrobiales bacterium]
MADLDHEHDEFAVLDIADDALVANCVAPIGTKLAAMKRIAKASRVVVGSKAFFKKLFDAALDDGVEFLDRFLNGLTILNRPGHARTPRN